MLLKNKPKTKKKPVKTPVTKADVYFKRNRNLFELLKTSKKWFSCLYVILCSYILICLSFVLFHTESPPNF